MISTSYISLIITAFAITTHFRSEIQASLHFFSHFKLQFSSHNSSISLHNHDYGVSLSKNPRLVWRIWSRIEQIESMNMLMELENWARSTCLQPLFLAQSFIGGLLEHIWRVWAYEHAISVHCISSRWKFDPHILLFHVHDSVDLVMPSLLIWYVLKMDEKWVCMMNILFWC